MSEKKEELLRAATTRESSEGLTHATTTEADRAIDWAKLLGYDPEPDASTPERVAAFLRIYARRIRVNERWDVPETMANAYESAALALDRYALHQITRVSPPSEAEREKNDHGAAPGICEWTIDSDEWNGDSWDSACGEKWCFIDGDPENNKHRFCPACGRPVKTLLGSAPEPASAENKK